MSTQLNVAAVSRNYFNMPLWVAQHCGFFEREGLSVRLHLIEAIDAVTAGLAAGQFQIDLGVTENVILNRERGGRLGILAGNVNRLPFSLIAQPSVRRITDLRGARIGVSSIEAGSSSLIMRLLAKHGLYYPADYTLLPVGPILARWTMLQSGEIEAGLQGAPMNYIAIEAGFNDLARPRDEFPDFQFTSVNCDLDWSSRNDEAVLAFLKAYIQAHRWLEANRLDARQIALEEAGLSARHADLAWDECVLSGIFPSDCRASLAGVDTLIEVSSQIRALPERATCSAGNYIDSKPLEQALQLLG